jgi:hypothetical protein
MLGDAVQLQERHPSSRVSSGRPSYSGHAVAPQDIERGAPVKPRSPRQIFPHRQDQTRRCSIGRSERLRSRPRTR